jgi:hypothetical protein
VVGSIPIAHKSQRWYTLYKRATTATLEPPSWVILSLVSPSCPTSMWWRCHQMMFPCHNKPMMTIRKTLSLVCSPCAFVVVGRFLLLHCVVSCDASPNRNYRSSRKDIARTAVSGCVFDFKTQVRLVRMVFSALSSRQKIIKKLTPHITPCK